MTQITTPHFYIQKTGEWSLKRTSVGKWKTNGLFRQMSEKGSFIAKQNPIACITMVKKRINNTFIIAFYFSTFYFLDRIAISTHPFIIHHIIICINIFWHRFNVLWSTTSWLQYVKCSKTISVQIMLKKTGYKEIFLHPQRNGLFKKTYISGICYTHELLNRRQLVCCLPTTQ